MPFVLTPLPSSHGFGCTSCVHTLYMRVSIRANNAYFAVEGRISNMPFKRAINILLAPKSSAIKVSICQHHFTKDTLGKFNNPLRKFAPPINFSASPQDGFGHGLSGSAVTGSRRFWNRRSTQSMIRMIRCGGLPNLRTGNAKVGNEKNGDVRKVLIMLRSVKLQCEQNSSKFACGSLSKSVFPNNGYLMKSLSVTWIRFPTSHTSYSKADCCFIITPNRLPKPNPKLYSDRIENSER